MKKIGKFIVYVFLIFFAVIGCSSMFAGSESSNNDTSSKSVQESQPVVQEPKEPDKYAGLTTEQVNAVKSAEGYLDYSGFSRERLIKQLEYEKYSIEAAEFAVDFCDPDWDAEAVESAMDYIDYSGFSKNGLLKQLEYEGFTHAQAMHGVDFCGADWNAEAVEKAKDYLDYSSFSRERLIEQLEYEGFTHDQAVYGVDQVY